MSSVVEKIDFTRTAIDNIEKALANHGYDMQLYHLGHYADLIAALTRGGSGGAIILGGDKIDATMLPILNTAQVNTVKKILMQGTIYAPERPVEQIPVVLGAPQDKIVDEPVDAVYGIPESTSYVLPDSFVLVISMPASLDVSNENITTVTSKFNDVLELMPTHPVLGIGREETVMMGSLIEIEVDDDDTQNNQQNETEELENA